MSRTQLFANQHKIAVNCESNSSRFSGLLLHFCAVVTAESIAYSSLPIRPVFVAFWAHNLGRVVAFLAKYILKIVMLISGGSALAMKPPPLSRNQDKMGQLPCQGRQW
jgi:hypothetical protein